VFYEDLGLIRGFFVDFLALGLEGFQFGAIFSQNAGQIRGAKMSREERVRAPRN
jgi:hypothetical protein